MRFDKPKALYFRVPLDKIPVRLREVNFLNRERGLKYYFDLIVVDYEADYLQILELHNPDLAFVEIHSEVFSPLHIRNIDSRKLPKIALVVVDAISPARYVALDYARSIKCDAVFTADVGYGTLTNYGFKNNLYYWPWFIDENVFKDYKKEKDIQFLKIGHSNATYPWRRKIFSAIQKKYFVTEIPYPTKTQKPIIGKEYAEWIHRSKFVPTCGGFIRVIVNKHLEIPASKSLLITQETEAIKEMGFVDMQNCVFAESVDDLEPKLKLLLTDQALYDKITVNGYELIHEFHNETKRPQLLQWFQLFKKYGLDVRQPCLFGDLVVSSTIKNYKISFSDATEYLKQVDELITKRQIEEGLKICDYLLKEYLSYSPDFLLRKSLLLMLTGNREAFKSLNELLTFELYYSLCDRPEPIEWSMYLLALLASRDKVALQKLKDTYSYEGYLFYYYVRLLIGDYLNEESKLDDLKLKIERFNVEFSSAHTFLNLSLGEIKNLCFEICGRQYDEIYSRLSYDKPLPEEPFKQSTTEEKMKKFNKFQGVMIKYVLKQGWIKQKLYYAKQAFRPIKPHRNF